MALKFDLNNGQTQGAGKAAAQTAGATAGQTAGGDQTAPGFKRMNFNQTVGFMNKRAAGADVTKFAKDINSALISSKMNVAVHIYSKATFPQLAFSNILVTMESDGKMAYFDILLEATGNNTMTTNKYMELIQMKEKPFVTTDAVDRVLFQIQEDELKQNNPSIKEFIPVEGITIPKNVDITDELIINEIAAEAFNAIYEGLGMKLGVLKDIDLEESLSTVTGFVKLRQITLTAPRISGLGKQSKVEWGVELSTTNKSTNTSPNTMGSENSIATAYGRINFLPESYTVATHGMQPVEKIGFHPQVVITNFELAVPSLGYALLSIVTSAVLAKDRNWIKPVLANNEVDIGVLNKIVNITNDPKGGKAIALSNPKMTDDDKVQSVATLVALTPVITLEATAFDENASILSAFTTAAMGSQGAARAIVDTLVNMTKGVFPANFNPANIFAAKPNIVPEGTWIDKNGNVRTIDDIDTKYILSVGGVAANQLASDYIYAELGLAQDGFTSRVELLQKLGIDAEITGRKMKMTLSSEFIETAIEAFTRCGLDARFEGNGDMYMKSTGFGFTNNMFDRANIENVNAFKAFTPNQGYGGYGNGFGMGRVYR